MAPLFMSTSALNNSFSETLTYKILQNLKKNEVKAHPCMQEKHVKSTKNRREFEDKF